MVNSAVKMHREAFLLGTYFFGGLLYSVLLVCHLSVENPGLAWTGFPLWVVAFLHTGSFFWFRMSKENREI